MKLRTRLGAYVCALHAPLFGCAVLLLPQRPLAFVAAEATLLASLATGWRLLRRALEPLGYTRRFRDMLQDRQYALRLAPAGGELGELVGLFNTMLDTLHRERLAAGEQQGFLDRLLEATPAAVIVFDFDHALSLWNAAAAHLLGLDGAAGKRLAQLPGAAQADGLPGQLDRLPPGEGRVLTDTDGRRYRAQRGQFFDRGFARHFLVVEELTAELEDSERAAYARLIRVLAHEVNNTVAATGSVLDSLLTYRGQLAADDADDFATAIAAVKRRNVQLGGFIDRFASVVKMPAPALRPTDVGAIVDDILRLNREHCAARGIALGWGRRDAVAPLALDAQLFEQALLNVVKNAIEAVEEGRQGDPGQAGGAVRIELADEGGRVRLSVVDSAGLLAGGQLRPLFTPFVSTKKGGQGIGLLFVREVLNRHGCTYALAPGAPGETRFTIWFAGS